MTSVRSSCFCIGVVFLLAGCTAPAPTVQRVPERCLGPETTIVARMPTPGGESATTARGVYIEANTVLTVAHALPSNATAEGFAGLRRDDERHLLLLQAETCGTPLAIAAGGMATGDALYDCTTKAIRGNVSGFEASAVAASPTSSRTVMLPNLAVLPGQFSPGDSGKPFCNAAGEVVGVLTAIRRGSALLIDAEELNAFVN